MIRRIDAWIFGRLLIGYSLNGELASVCEEFRQLALDMGAMAPEDRRTLFEGFLCGRPDREALKIAIAQENPLGPTPEIDPQAGPELGDGWEPIRLVALSPPESFPLDVLPQPASRLAVEGSESIGCPIDFLGVAMLVVIAGTIGRSVELLLKFGYFASSTLFAACIGPPSNGKTPAFKLAVKAIRRISEILAAQHAQAMEHWHEENKPTTDNKKPKPTAPPKPQRIDVDDITMEAVPMRLADNPRGLIMLRDELSALLLGMNQYKGGKGNDRSVLMKIWSGEDITRDRVSDDAGIPLNCPHPSMSILGGLPPAMLGSLQDAKGSDDGFVDRFLFAYPEPTAIADWSERGVSDDIIDEWCELVARIWKRQLEVREGRSLPHISRFTPEGKTAWQSHHKTHVDEMNAPDFPPAMRGPFGKLGEYAGRFTLILACAHHASDPRADPTSVPDVGPESVDRAWRLVTYFKSHSKRVHQIIGQGTGVGGGKVVKSILEWLLDSRQNSFSEHELKQARRWINADELDEAIVYLADRNVIRRQEPSKPSYGGRPHSSVYDVHPALLDTQNP